MKKHQFGQLSSRLLTSFIVAILLLLHQIISVAATNKASENTGESKPLNSEEVTSLQKQLVQMEKMNENIMNDVYWSLLSNVVTILTVFLVFNSTWTFMVNDREKKALKNELKNELERKLNDQITEQIRSQLEHQLAQRISYIRERLDIIQTRLKLIEYGMVNLSTDHLKQYAKTQETKIQERLDGIQFLKSMALDNLPPQEFAVLVEYELTELEQMIISSDFQLSENQVKEIREVIEDLKNLGKYEDRLQPIQDYLNLVLAQKQNKIGLS